MDFHLFLKLKTAVTTKKEPQWTPFVEHVPQSRPLVVEKAAKLSNTFFVDLKKVIDFAKSFPDLIARVVR